jgi:hypothetical protein
MENQAVFPLKNISTIAIADDDLQMAYFTEQYIIELGLNPLVIKADHPFQKVSDLTQVIKTEAQAAICDHRLRYRSYANFSGADVIAELYDCKIPGILVTQWKGVDRDVSIRRWRRKIPVLLSHDDTTAEAIKSGLVYCLSEINGYYSSERKPYRAIIIVTGISNESSEEVVDAIVPSWRPHEGVRFPASLIQAEIRGVLKPGMMVFGQVNTGAETVDDLYFEENKFELAPTANPDDEIT